MRRVGPWEVEWLEGERFSLDGGAMFGIVPRTQWEKRFTPDESGRVRLAARCLLLRHDDGHVVLVDAGMGCRWLGRARATYAVSESGGLLEQLAEKGVERSDVTDVVMTHLHFDHAGGLVCKEGDRGLVPTFPEAKVHIQRQQLAWAREPSPRDRASFRLADFVPIIEAGLAVEHDGPGEIIPDVHIIISHGHTPAMQVPIIGMSEGGVVFPSDMIPTSAHVHPAWNMAFDNQPVLTVTEKAKLLEEAARNRWIIVPDHDPDLAAFRVESGPRGFTVVELDD